MGEVGVRCMAGWRPLSYRGRTKATRGWYHKHFKTTDEDGVKRKSDVHEFRFPPKCTMGSVF